MRTLKLLPVVLLLASCEAPLEAAQEKARTESFTAVLEAVERNASALSASKQKNDVDTDDIIEAFDEFPGNGFELAQSNAEVVVTVSTGMYAGCSATLTPTSTGYGVSIDDVECSDTQEEAPGPNPEA